MKILKWFDRQADNLLTKGSKKPFLEYTIKYFLSIGIGIHLIGFVVIVISIMT